MKPRGWRHALRPFDRAGDRGQRRQPRQLRIARVSATARTPATAAGDGHAGIGGGQAGSGGGHAGSGGGHAGAAAGAAAGICRGHRRHYRGCRGGAATGTAGTAGTAGSSGTVGAAGQAGGGGASGGQVGTGLSVSPSAATFASTLVESVSAPRTFTRATTAAPTALSRRCRDRRRGLRIMANTVDRPGNRERVATSRWPSRRRSGAGREARPSPSVPRPARAKSRGPPPRLPSLNLLAGTLGGFGNLDGTGAAARFDYPIGVASDGAGNLYVADATTTPSGKSSSRRRRSPRSRASPQQVGSATASARPRASPS